MRIFKFLEKKDLSCFTEKSLDIIKVNLNNKYTNKKIKMTKNFIKYSSYKPIIQNVLNQS